MLNKNFEKGITILEALVATVILGMIATFFISTSAFFLRSQQEMISQGMKINKWGKNVYVKVPVTNSKGKFMGKVIKKLNKQRSMW